MAIVNGDKNWIKWYSTLFMEIVFNVKWCRMFSNRNETQVSQIFWTFFNLHTKPLETNEKFIYQKVIVFSYFINSIPRQYVGSDYQTTTTWLVEWCFPAWKMKASASKLRMLLFKWMKCDFSAMTNNEVHTLWLMSKWKWNDKNMPWFLWNRK